MLGISEYSIVIELLTFGKNPDQVEGYVWTKVSDRASRIDQFYRWIRDKKGRYVAGR